MHSSSIKGHWEKEASDQTAEWVEFDNSVDYRASKIINCERRVAVLCKPIGHYCDLAVNVFDAFLSSYEKYTNEGDEFARERAFSLGKRLYNFLNEVLPHHENYNVDCWDIQSVLYIETRLDDCIRVLSETSNMAGKPQDFFGAIFYREGEDGKNDLDPPMPSDMCTSEGNAEISKGIPKNLDHNNRTIRQSLRLRDLSNERLSEKNQNGKSSRNDIVLESTEVGVSDVHETSISRQNSIGDGTGAFEIPLQTANNCHENDDPTIWQNGEVVNESIEPSTSRISFISLMDLWKQKEKKSINLKENNRCST